VIELEEKIDERKRPKETKKRQQTEERETR
jgi:hypothetical protein